jgi:L-fucose mutarotase/ribose pyranase (RbsD/FucU family)
VQQKIRKPIRSATLVVALTMVALVVGCDGGAGGGSGWQNKLATELPVLGHRNWILIADSAYPAQGRAGIETIATGADQLQVVKAVLKAIDDTPHVRPNVYLDAEIDHVPQEDAPGIDRYRKQLAAMLKGLAVKKLAHEDLIAKLDEAAKTFRVLVLKTNLTLPYTSVFLELDCGYWNANAERKLRQAMPGATR